MKDQLPFNVLRPQEGAQDSSLSNPKEQRTVLGRLRSQWGWGEPKTSGRKETALHFPRRQVPAMVPTPASSRGTVLPVPTPSRPSQPVCTGAQSFAPPDAQRSPVLCTLGPGGEEGSGESQQVRWGQARGGWSPGNGRTWADCHRARPQQPPRATDPSERKQPAEEGAPQVALLAWPRLSWVGGCGQGWTRWGAAAAAPPAARVLSGRACRCTHHSSVTSEVPWGAIPSDYVSASRRPSAGLREDLC